MSSASGDKRRALGRGLESLLPSRPKPAVETATPVAAVADGKPLEIPVEKIDRNPFQTRTGFDEEKLKELAAIDRFLRCGAADHRAQRHGRPIHADHRRAALAGEPAGGQGDDSGDCA